ncbi:agmatine/peptidylarginine deiminase [Pedobacter foliorum]|uniref:agmatine deiminase family protein n=1 Tax=Pedobacter foliorum TaxID=2739058 RepID=UPI0015637CC5|nr:agmatine deiminase family protein [Pedobacter foliorum]NRF37714.1 agmatine deiminase family protein [Pedobacter foliorum]
MNKMLFLMISILTTFSSCQKSEENYQPADSAIMYTMPEESAPHEGTWLQWPHQYQYGITYRNRLDDTWVKMTQALVESENVHIVAFDDAEKKRIMHLLDKAGIPLTNVDFKIHQTDDVWVRDNGPIYVRDQKGQLIIEDWGFNGWGKKAAYQNCNAIPAKIANDQNKEKIDLNKVMINEGGAIEIDGNGTLLATKSAILNNNRNPDMTQAQAEAIFTKYLGGTKYIWLKGKAGLEITDMHIDGFARFGNTTTLVTMNEDDLLDWQVPDEDIRTLYAATDKNGIRYNIVKVPLTQNDVVTTYGKKLGYKGSYVNYYIGNKKVLVPNYNDPNDAVANKIIQSLYPDRTVVGIDVRDLYANGGMIHCVTQQQPKDK